jgi:hypothetical protein
VGLDGLTISFECLLPGTPSPGTRKPGPREVTWTERARLRVECGLETFSLPMRGSPGNVPRVQ